MKNTQGYTFACDNKRNTDRISSQFILRRYIFVSSSEQVSQQYNSNQKGQSTSREIYITRFIII